MADNAGIVREVITLFANLHPWPLHSDQRAEIDKGLVALSALDSELAAYKRLAKELEGEDIKLRVALATAKADLERAREALSDLLRYVDPYIRDIRGIYLVRPEVEKARAALAPEQKGE